MTIRAIETRYAGYRFRSRLEARWAVFFDTLGVRWEYEKQGYDLGPDGLYLPDFWFPAPHRFWGEVKPETPTEEEHRKARGLAITTRSDVVFLIGVPGESGCGLIESARYLWYEFDDFELANFLADPDEYGGPERVKEMVRLRAWPLRNDPLTFAEVFGPGRDWQTAITAARSARFEHGETPPPR